jgi:hypothetical protein
MSIPTSEAVTPAMLENLRKKLGLSVTDFCWCFCLSLPAWNKMKKYDPDNGIFTLHEKVADPAIALYARLLDKRPEICPLPRQVSARDLFDTLKQLKGDFTKKELATMIGRESSSGYRWIEQTGKMPPILQRIGRMLMDNIKEALSVGDHDLAERVLNEWMLIVAEESKARNISNVMALGNWNREPVARPTSPTDDHRSKFRRRNRVPQTQDQ